MVSACGAERYPICMTYASPSLCSYAQYVNGIYKLCVQYSSTHSGADLPPQQPPRSDCMSGDVRLGSLYYYVSRQPADGWSAARQQRAQRSAFHDLVSIHNAFEQNFLLAMLQLIPGIPVNASVSIGLHNMNVCGLLIRVLELLAATQLVACTLRTCTHARVGQSLAANVHELGSRRAADRQGQAGRRDGC